MRTNAPLMGTLFAALLLAAAGCAPPSAVQAERERARLQQEAELPEERELRRLKAAEELRTWRETHPASPAEAPEANPAKQLP